MSVYSKFLLIKVTKRRETDMDKCKLDIENIAVLMIEDDVYPNYVSDC